MLLSFDFFYPAPQASMRPRVRKQRETVVRRPDDLFIEGWVFDDANASLPSTATALIDGVPTGFVMLGLQRPDVATHLSAPAAEKAGFLAKLPTAHLDFGKHLLTLRFAFGNSVAESQAVEFELCPTVTLPAQQLPRICFVGAPKTGGTFTEEVVVRYMGITNPTYAGEWRWETLLNDGRVHVGYDGPYVMGGHMLPREINLEIAAENGLSVAAGWRNIADSLISLDDHCHREMHVLPFMYIGQWQQFFQLSDQERYRFLIRHAAPWYIDYYCSWLDVGVPIFARYEWMATDPFGFFHHLIESLFGAVDVERLKEVLSRPFEKGTIRFNKGVNGRANEHFTDETKALLEETIRDHWRPLGELIDELPWRRGPEASIALAHKRVPFEKAARPRDVPAFLPVREPSPT